MVTRRRRSQAPCPHLTPAYFSSCAPQQADVPPSAAAPEARRVRVPGLALGEPASASPKRRQYRCRVTAGALIRGASSLVDRVENRGMPHLARSSARPRTRRAEACLGFRGFASELSQAAISSIQDADGQRDRRPVPVEALPVEVPVVDVDQRLDGFVLHPRPDLHLAAEQVHVRMDRDQLHRPVHEGSGLDLVARTAPAGIVRLNWPTRMKCRRFCTGAVAGAQPQLGLIGLRREARVVVVELEHDARAPWAGACPRPPAGPTGARRAPSRRGSRRSCTPGPPKHG